ncbi:MAG: preprotein translocase subunit YajC [Proteobacteria bacterium]|nr:preprotein translocase subunit YajC [Pseudomonadota bacterium]
MLISPAYAQAAGDGGAGGMLQLLPLVLIFVVFYFLLIRPQQKKAKMHRSMVEAVKRGDKVITGGGLIGTVTKAPEGGEIQVEIAEGVRVKVMRHTLTEILTKPEPASKAGGKKPANDTGAGQASGGFALGKLLGLGGKKPDG